MSGKFFKHLSDSESESSDSEEEVPTQRPAQVPTYDFSDEEEEQKRILRTTKEKRYGEILALIKQIKNHRKIKDFTKMLTAFENLVKAFAKAKPVVDKEEAGVTPRFYIRCLVEMSDLVDECWDDKEFKKKMNKDNAKSLTTLRQKLRKYMRENHYSEVAKYRENPDTRDSSGSSEEEASPPSSEDEEEEEKKAQVSEPDRAKGFMKTAGSSSDSSSDSDEWPSSDESSLSSDDEKYGENLALKFLKKEKEEGRGKEKKQREKKDRRRKAEEPDDDKEEWKVVKGGTVTKEKPKLFQKDEEVNHETVVNKIGDILLMRGKKRIHRSEQLDLLSELLILCAEHKLGPAVEIKLIFAMLGAVFSYNSSVSSCMKTSYWTKCLEYSNQMLQVLEKHPDLSVGERISEDSESFASVPYRVSGCPLTLIERVDDEFTKMLQSVDAHSPDYIERLKDEKLVCEIIDRLAVYLEANGRGTSLELCRVYILKIDHLYYKFDSAAVGQKKPIEDGGEGKGTSVEVMGRLCKFIYTNDQTDRIRTQAMLCHIYHHALHDNWFEARDLMLMSHLQHTITKSDIPLHILYNRALVQLGLCAFRHGNIKDAHTALLDIQIQGRAKELLAQGLLPRQQERTPEQEKQEKRRLLPFHKHINLELLECVYLVSAMLLEIPDVAANEYSIRKKMISRSFYNQLRKNEEQPLVGLPESMREHVVAASKAMRVGNWRACVDFIINEKMNNKVWNLFHRPDTVREMLVKKIREESLRAYLFTYSHVYDSISLDVLSRLFDLDKATVHSIVSKMMTNEELMTSLDEPTQTLIMHRTEPSRIQGLSLQLADKINILVEQNERLWEAKQMGIYGAANQGRMDRGYGGKDGEERGGYQRGGRNWTERLGYNENRNRHDGRRGGQRFDRRQQREVRAEE